MQLNEPFRKFAVMTSKVVGSAYSFILALIIIFVWAITGPLFNFSDTWQLVINTGTTIVTFLIVFLIQNTQNRDSKALHIKIDELLKGVKGARNELVDIEELPDEEIELLHKEFRDMHIRYKNEMVRRGRRLHFESKKQIDAKK